MFNVSFKKCGVALVASTMLLLSGCGSPEERAQTHYERGLKLLAEKNYVTASVEFKSALKLKQNLVGAWLGLADIEERNQNWAALAAILRTVSEHDPNNVPARLRHARLMLLANSLDEALKSVNAAVERDARNTSAVALKAAILLKLNDSQGAIQNAHAVLQIEPDSLEALMVLAAERMTQNDNEGALKLLNGASAKHAGNLSLQLFQVGVYEKLGDFTKVEQILRQIANSAPKELAYRKPLVQFYLQQKQPAKAENELRAISTENPADIEAGLDVVRYLNATKGVVEARQELLRRIGSGGDIVQYQLALADLYAAEGNLAGSTELLEKLSTDASQGAQTLLAKVKLAELHMRNRKPDAAEQLLNAVLQKDSRNAAALQLRSKLNLERGQVDTAIADLRQALNDQPRDAELQMLMALAYERAGSIELADKQFADALRVSNFDARVGLSYVSFLRRRGNAARAEDILSDLAVRWPNNLGILTELAEVRLMRNNWAGAEELAGAI